MSDLQVIYDPNAELATVIDLEARCVYGPTMVGPNADRIVQVFLDAVPFSLDAMTVYERQRAFEEFLRNTGMEADVEAGEGGTPPAQQDGNPNVDADAARAEAEAHASGDVPKEQSADTDDEAGTTPQDQVGPGAQKVIDCVNCGGSGEVQFGNDEPAQRCGMCQGKGKIVVAAEV